MKSLLIASLPKSSSTAAYANVAQATRHELRQIVPRGGEVIGLLDGYIEKLHGERDEQALLDHFRQYKDDCVIKDVLATQLVPQLTSDFNVLCVHRNPADLLYLRLNRKAFPWEMMLLPEDERPDMSPFCMKVVQRSWIDIIVDYKEPLARGILLGQKLLQEHADEVVQFDQLVTRPQVLWDAIRNLGYKADAHDYASKAKWQSTVKSRWAVRDTAEWKQLDALMRSLS